MSPEVQGGMSFPGPENSKGKVWGTENTHLKGRGNAAHMNPAPGIGEGAERQHFRT